MLIRALATAAYTCASPLSFLLLCSPLQALNSGSNLYILLLLKKNSAGHCMPSIPGDVSVGVGDFSWLKGSLGSSFSSFPDAEVVIQHHSCRCRATHVCARCIHAWRRIYSRRYGRTKRERSFSMVLINPPAPSHHIRPKPGHASGWQAYGMAICQPLLLCSPWTTQIMSQHTSARRCLSHCRPDDRSECLLQLFFDVRVSSAQWRSQDEHLRGG